MTGNRRVSLPLLILPVWVAARLCYSHCGGLPTLREAYHWLAPPRYTAQSGAAIANATKATAVPVVRDTKAVASAASPQTLPPVDGKLDLAHSLATLVADQLQPPQGIDVPALPVGLDWEALSKHGLMIPPADRVVATDPETVEAPLPAPLRWGEHAQDSNDQAAKAIATLLVWPVRPPESVRHTSTILRPDQGGAETAPLAFPCGQPAKTSPHLAQDPYACQDTDAPLAASPNRAESGAGSEVARQPDCGSPPARVDPPKGEPPGGVEALRRTIARLPTLAKKEVAPEDGSPPPMARKPLEAPPAPPRPPARPAAQHVAAAVPPPKLTPPPSPLRPQGLPPKAAPGAAARGSTAWPSVQVTALGAAPAPLVPALQRAHDAEMQAVARLADAHTRHGFELASRRALYSARDEFVHGLGMIAQALDAAEHDTAHVRAMSDGMTALEEANDFVASSGQLTTNFDAVAVARPHATSVLKNRQPCTVSAMRALQEYFSYAQARLAFAAGHQPAGSLALLGLGKVYAALGKAQDSNAIAAEPKAIVFYQAALLVDPRNFMAANELGVLLANYGKYDQAMAAFVQSLKVSPQPVTWQNLAVVHAQLGQTELAQRAMREAALAARRGVDQAPGPLGLSVKPYDIQWVDPGTFARVGESPAVADPRPGRPPVQKRAAAASTGVSPWH